MSKFIVAIICLAGLASAKKCYVELSGSVNGSESHTLRTDIDCDGKCVKAKGDISFGTKFSGVIRMCTSGASFQVDGVPAPIRVPAIDCVIDFFADGKN